MTMSVFVTWHQERNPNGLGQHAQFAIYHPRQQLTRGSIARQQPRRTPRNIPPKKQPILPAYTFITNILKYDAHNITGGFCGNPFSDEYENHAFRESVKSNRSRSVIIANGVGFFCKKQTSKQATVTQTGEVIP